MIRASVRGINRSRKVRPGGPRDLCIPGSLVKEAGEAGFCLERADDAHGASGLNHAWLIYPGQPRRPSWGLRLPPCERIGKLPTAMTPTESGPNARSNADARLPPGRDKNPAFDGPCRVISVDQRCRLQAWAERTYCGPWNTWFPNDLLAFQAAAECTQTEVIKDDMTCNSQ